MRRLPLAYQPDEFIPPEKKKNNKFATAGLFLGAAGVILMSFGVLSAVENAAGIAVSIKGLKSAKRVSAIVGLVSSGACFILSVAFYIYRYLYLKK